MRIVEVGPGRVPSKIGVAVAEFNAAITGPMATEAVAALDAAGVSEVVRMDVPGALELPVAALHLLEAGCEGVVAVGAIIKGETDHYEFVAAESARGLGEVGLLTGRPVGNAVLTVREFGHAVERSLPGASNKGREVAESVVAMCRILEGLK